MSVSKALLDTTTELSHAVGCLAFSPPVTHVYNPLEYAWKAHEQYLKRFGSGRKRVVLMGMNPGPWGMSQTGVPFGEVAAVRDWMGIDVPVGKPKVEHPKRPIEGFACAKSEVSGRRLWGLFSERFDSPEAFFAEHLVINYCPLVFMEESGRNRTPDKIPAGEMAPVHKACSTAIRQMLETLKPEWVVGVGGFAEKRLAEIIPDLAHSPQLGRVLHPSPASPAANRGWAEAAEQQLVAQGIWANS